MQREVYYIKLFKEVINCDNVLRKIRILFNKETMEVTMLKKRFNTTGVCIPKKHYMVDINDNLRKIKSMVDEEQYFVINRPRQYGKTTTIYMLKQYLKEEFLVLSMSFEGIDEEEINNVKKFQR